MVIHIKMNVYLIKSSIFAQQYCGCLFLQFVSKPTVRRKRTAPNRRVSVRASNEVDINKHNCEFIIVK